MNKRSGLLALAFVLVTAVAIPVAYFAALLVVPNRTAEGHGLMPIGQVAFAMAVGPVLGAAAAYLLARRL
ncbi:MAG: hypothetical protein IPG50_18605 [Myxococcales bacterium]|nr:hypothetical protein [Myxococcales bacterium]